MSKKELDIEQAILEYFHQTQEQQMSDIGAATLSGLKKTSRMKVGRILRLSRDFKLPETRV